MSISMRGRRSDGARAAGRYEEAYLPTTTPSPCGICGRRSSSKRGMSGGRHKSLPFGRRAPRAARRRRAAAPHLCPRSPRRRAAPCPRLAAGVLPHPHATGRPAAAACPAFGGLLRAMRPSACTRTRFFILPAMRCPRGPRPIWIALLYPVGAQGGGGGGALGAPYRRPGGGARRVRPAAAAHGG